jgi:hypothetical protein
LSESGIKRQCQSELHRKRGLTTNLQRCRIESE